MENLEYFVNLLQIHAKIVTDCRDDQMLQWRNVLEISIN